MGIFVSREDVRRELEQVKAQFDSRVAQMEGTILAEIRQTNVNLLQSRIDNSSKQLTVLNDVTERLRQLTSQVEDLKHVVDQLSPVSPNGEPKSIHEVIGTHTQKISNAVESIHTAHAIWLNEQMGGLEKAREVTANLQELLNRSKQNISPQTGVVEVPQEVITPEQENHV